MKSIFNKILPFTLGAIISIASSAQVTTSPAYVPNLWYSLGKTITGFATASPPSIDGVFDDFVWTSPSKNAFANGAFPASTKLEQSINISGNEDTRTLNSRVIANTAEESATFGVAYDENYLYIAASVKSAKMKALSSLPAQAGVLAVELFLGADGSTRTYHQDGEKLFNINSNYPQALNSNEFQLRFGPSASSFNTFINTDTKSLFVDRGPFGNSDIKGFTKITDQGYNLEVGISWRAINDNFINPATNQYNNPTDVPQNGKVYLLDLGLSQTNNTGTDRSSQLMWNACCINRNWTESIHWGTLVLSGNPGPVELQSVSMTAPNITDGNPQNITVSVVPEEADKNLQYSVITDNCSPVLKVTPNGQIIPLNNGTATIIGTSLSKKFAPNAVSVTSAIVTVSNQSVVTDLVINPSSLSKNWSSTILSANVNPSLANQEVVWSVVSGGELITLNSVTGLVRSKSLEASSTITVKATSIADCNKSAEGTVQISNQTPLTANNFAITTFQNKSCNSTDDVITLVGFVPNTTKITLRSIFKIPGNDTVQIVSPDLMSYSFSVPRGQNLSNILTVSKAGVDTEILLKAAVGTFSITGTYLNSNISKTLRVRLAASTPETTCPSTINTTPTIDASSLEVSPNPTSGTFSVDLSLSKASSVNVSVLNSVGSLVYTSTTAQGIGASKIPVAAVLSKGIYIVKVTSADGTSLSKKLVVE